jgi:hypothetical protein
MNRTVGALTLLNLVLLAFQLSRDAGADDVSPIVRAREIQLVDEKGRVRSELKVLPAGTANGVQYEETVIFRLVTADGKPRVKLTTSTDGSGLLLLGTSDETYARVVSTKIDLVDGAKTRTFTP